MNRHDMPGFRPEPNPRASHPYAELNPESVLNALFLAGLDADGRLLQLNSYENRVWQAHLEDGRVAVVKFYRPGRWSDAQLLEEHHFAAELAEAELPVAAPWALVDRGLDPMLLSVDPFEPTLAHFRSPGGTPFRMAVWARQSGRAPELEHHETLAWLGRLLGRWHALSARRPFEHRPTLDSTRLGHQPRQGLIDSGRIHPAIDGAWLRASADALDLVDGAFARVPGLRHLRLHGDCHTGNILWRADGLAAGPHFVDLDDCAMGPAIQDLWMLLPGEGGRADGSLHTLLDGYREFMDFDDRELSLIEPLRTLRMIHHSAWIAERWADPAFPPAFPWFASPAYWQQQATELREQCERMA